MAADQVKVMREIPVWGTIVFIECDGPDKDFLNSGIDKCAEYFREVDEVFSTLYTGGVSTNSPFRLYRESTRITDKYFKLSFLQKIVANSKLIVALSYVQIILFYSFVIKKIKLTKCLILK